MMQPLPSMQIYSFSLLKSQNVFASKYFVYLRIEISALQYANKIVSISNTKPIEQ